MLILKSLNINVLNQAVFIQKRFFEFLIQSNNLISLRAERGRKGCKFIKLQNRWFLFANGILMQLLKWLTLKVGFISIKSSKVY